ncbi:nucleotidyltransferase domain-containing protein [Rhodocaloribacter sp.]
MVRAALVDARRRLEALYGERLVHVVLYGSQARGEAVADSDVDVLVVLKEPVNVLVELKRLTRLKLEFLEQYGKDFSFRPVTEDAYLDRDRPLMTNVHAEGLKL